MKRLFPGLMSCLLLAGLVLACSKDKSDPISAPVELSLSKTVLNFGFPAAKDSVVVTSNYGWNFELAKPEDAAWCQLTANDTLLLVALSANEQPESRSAEITVTASSSEKSEIRKISVTQRGFVAGEAPVVIPDPQQLTFESWAGDAKKTEVTLYNHADFPLSWKWVDEQSAPVEKPEWLEEPVLGEDGFTLTVKTAAANPEKTERKAWLLLVCGEEGFQGTALLPITQKGTSGEPYLNLTGEAFEGDTLFIPQSGEEVFLTVATNLPWGEAPYPFSDYFKGLIGMNFDRLHEETGVVWREVPQTVPQRELELKATTKTFGFKYAPDGTNAEPNTGLDRIGTGYGIYFRATLGSGEAQYENIEKDIDIEREFGVHVRGLAAAKLEVGKNLLSFGKEAAYEEVAVTSDMEWSFEQSAEASWMKVEKTETGLKVTVEANTSGTDRNGLVTVISGGSRVQIQVYQSKEEFATYQLGDVYKLDGKPAGIVYKLLDAEGKHGLVFALKEFNKDSAHMGLYFSKDLYAGEAGDLDQYPSKSVAHDEKDGRENMEKFKSRTFTDGKDWTYHYPAAAWVDGLNTEHSYSGKLNVWYIPALDELSDLLIYLDGNDARWKYWKYDADENVTPPQLPKTRYEEINKKLKENGGMEITFTQETLSPYQKNYTSSTEIRDRKYPQHWTIRFDYGYASDLNSKGIDKDTDISTFSVRPVLRF